MIARQPASDSARPIQKDARGRLRSTSHDRMPTNTGVLLPRIDATAAPVCITAVFHSAMSSAKNTPPATAVKPAVPFLCQKRGLSPFLVLPGLSRQPPHRGPLFCQKRGLSPFLVLRRISHQGSRTAPATSTRYNADTAPGAPAQRTRIADHAIPLTAASSAR